LDNTDKHLKNWSPIYSDKRSATLSPANDFVSTIAYIEDEKATLNFSRTKCFDELAFDELNHLVDRALLPAKNGIRYRYLNDCSFPWHWQKEKIT
jgi:serine/threonine-protein kinase HipA